MGKPQSNFQYRTIFGVPLIAGNVFGLGVRWGFPSLKLNSSINLKFKYNV